MPQILAECLNRSEGAHLGARPAAGEYLLCDPMGSILSRIEPSDKPGTVQIFTGGGRVGL